MRTPFIPAALTLLACGLPPEGASSLPGQSAAPSFTTLAPDMLGLSWGARAAVVLPGPVPRVGLYADGGMLTLLTWDGSRLHEQPAPILDIDIGWVGAGDVDGDGLQEVLVRTPGAVHAYDAVTWDLLLDLRVSALPNPVSWDPYGYDDKQWPVASVQADADAAPEIAVVHASRVDHYEASGAWIRSTSLVHTHPLLGQLDADPAPEVLDIVDGRAVQIDLATLQDEGPVHGAFGRVDRFLDTDGDGIDEVSMQLGGLHVLVDARSGASVWTVQFGSSMAWVDADVMRGPGGTRELWVPDSYDEDVLVLDAVTGLPVAALERPSARDPGLAWDADGDGIDEWLTHDTSSVALADGPSRTWLTVQQRVYGIDTAADLDGDGADEVVTCGYREMGVRSRDDMGLLYATPLPGDDSGVDSCAAGDVDGDGIDEVAVTIDGLAYMGRLTPGGVDVRWTLDGLSAGPWLLDTNGDGRAEAYAITTEGDLCGWGPGATTAAWCVPGFVVTRPSAVEAEMFDFEGDGRAELVVSAGPLRALRAGTGEVLFEQDGRAALLMPWKAGSQRRLLFGRQGDPGLILSELRLGRAGAEVVEVGRYAVTEANALVAAGGYMWVSGSNPNYQVIRFDPVTGVGARLQIRGGVDLDVDAVVAGGRLWVDGWSGYLGFDL